MDVRKTNGSIEEFDKAKLARGIHEAYKSAKEYCDDAIVVSIINNLYIYEGITSAEIRRQVEESLMSINKRVAHTRTLTSSMRTSISARSAIS